MKKKEKNTHDAIAYFFIVSPTVSSGIEIGSIKRKEDTDNRGTSCKSTINILINTQRGDPDIWLEV